MTQIAENLDIVKEKLELACQMAGRKSNEVALMAVSKNHPQEAILEAIEAGHHLFGENRVQEAVEKFSGIKDPCELHIIGHLQRNKVKNALGVSRYIESVDSERLLKKINEEASGNRISILIEMNTSGETSKFGIECYDDLRHLLDFGERLENIRFEGLMTIAPFVNTDSHGEIKIRESFRMLKENFDKIEAEYDFPDWKVLSMGMSGDFPIAIEEGSTLVRVGTAIFGSRIT